MSRFFRRLGVRVEKLFTNRTSSKSKRKTGRRQLCCEALEDRRLMASAIGQSLLDNVTKLLVPGTDRANAIDRLATQALGRDIPVINESLSQALDVAGKLRIPFDRIVNLAPQIQAAATTDANIATVLSANGLTATRTSTGVTVTYQTSFNTQNVVPSFSVGGTPGFNYFNGTDPGKLTAGLPVSTANAKGALSGSATIVFGIDASEFFVDSAQTNLSIANLPTVTFQNVAGKVGIGKLRDSDQVNGRTTLTIDQAGFTLNDTVDSTRDNKLRLPQLQTPNGAAVTPQITGFVELSGPMAARCRR
jgi:hypothetical protein